MKSNGYKPEVLDKLHKVQLQILEDFIKVCDKYELSYFVVYGTAIGAVRHKGFIPWDDDIDVGMLREDYNKFVKVFDAELSEKYNLLTPEIDGRYACTVTHIQRKGTVFISEMSKDLKCEQCIFMDIFPFDYVARDEKKAKRQGSQANLWGKLLFLSGTGHPLIPYKGVTGAAMKAACQCIHLLLKILHIKPEWLYRKFRNVSTAYNHSEARSRYVTSFEYAGCIKDKIKAKEIFPLKEVAFEHLKVKIPNNNHELLQNVYGDYMKVPAKDKQVNHMPLIIQFEGEKPIYEDA